MGFGLPARHIDADFTDDGLRHPDIDAIDAREVNAADAVQFVAQVELRRVAAGLPAMFDARLARSDW